MKKLLHFLALVLSLGMPLGMLGMELHSDDEADLNLPGDEYLLAVEKMHEANKLPQALEAAKELLEKKHDEEASSDGLRTTLGKLKEPLKKERTRTGQNVLHLVATYPNASKKLIKLLLSSVQDHLENLILEQDRNGNTPLHLAAQLDNSRFLKLLVEEYGIILPLEMVNKEGKTSLYCAAEHGRDAVVKMLLEQGANVCASAHNGMTPLIASFNGLHDSTIDILLEEASIKQCINYTDDQGMNALAWARLAHADQERIDKLIDLGAEPSSQENTL